MSNEKKAYLIIGCNGSGKSTYYSLVLKDKFKSIPHINTDDISRLYEEQQGMSKKESIEKSSIEALKQIMNNIKREKTFSFETLFTDSSLVGSLAIARELKRNDYIIEAFAIHTNNAEININNVEIRYISNIGHFVNRNIIEERHKRFEENYSKFMLDLFDKITIIDNSHNEFEHKLTIDTYNDRHIPKELKYVFAKGFKSFKDFEKECILRNKDELYKEFISSLPLSDKTIIEEKRQDISIDLNTEADILKRG